MSFPLNDRLLQVAEKGDVYSLRKMVRDSQSLFDPNGRDYYPFGECALSKAVKGGHVEIVRMLLEIGADPNLYNAILITPLHLAALGNHLQIAKLLIVRGAKLDFRARNEMQPIDFCNYNTEMWQLLYDAARGQMPIILERSPLSRVPPHAIPKLPPEEPKKSGKGKQKKKGGSGKKKSGKKGKKKKGK